LLYGRPVKDLGLKDFWDWFTQPPIGSQPTKGPLCRGTGHDHLPAFYNLADLFVFPSLYEGFGIPLLEMMACDCAGIYDVLSNSERRSSMIAKGVERAKDFSWENGARQTLKVLESVGV
jgi:glycosyltransferase involved in cell wall biosynthesis